MKKTLLLFTIILCSFQISFSQVNLYYFSNFVFDGGATGVGIGNGDGTAQTGETIGLRIELGNNGGQDAHNITSVISSSDTNVVIIDNDVILPDIITSGSGASYDEFLFEIKNNCASGYVNFIFTTTCFEGTFVEPFIFYIDCSTVSLSEIIKTKEISISPNPASSDCLIKSDKMIEEVRIINSLGETMFNQNINATSALLDLRKFQHGIYFMEIMNVDKSKSVKKLSVTE